MYTKYDHHGTEVTVKTENKGKHRENCLCYDCEVFKTGCLIAKAVYKNCVDFDIVTPVWECPKFIEVK